MNYIWLVLGVSLVAGADACQPVSENVSDAQQEEICVVCRDGLAASDECGPIVQLPCRHCFHQNCIEQWLLSNPCCPLCRAEIAIEQVIDLQAAVQREWDRLARSEQHLGLCDGLCLSCAECCCFVLSWLDDGVMWRAFLQRNR